MRLNVSISHVGDFLLFLFHYFFQIVFFGVFLHAELGVILANALSSILLGP